MVDFDYTVLYILVHIYVQPYKKNIGVTYCVYVALLKYLDILHQPVVGINLATVYVPWIFNSRIFTFWTDIITYHKVAVSHDDRQEVV